MGLESSIEDLWDTYIIEHGHHLPALGIRHLQFGDVHSFRHEKLILSKMSRTLWRGEEEFVNVRRGIRVGSAVCGIRNPQSPIPKDLWSGKS